MAMERAAVSSSPIRVLSRRSPPRSAPTTSFPLPSSSSNHQNPRPIPSPSPLPRSTSPSTTSSREDGVVVVGFVGSSPTTDATHLVDKILDAKIFASGNLHQRLPLPPQRRRFLRHHIAYHFDADKAMLFLHLSLPPLSPTLPSSSSEDIESDHLRGLLFMFSVCHIVLFLHDGLRFDTQILKTIRVLQSAKHALSPFIRSEVAPTSASKPSTSPPARRPNRHSSSISLLSGSSSRSSALPGRCTPVVLFVFLNDFAPCDGASPSNTKDDTSTLRSSGSVVVLARPASKGEGCFKKKLLTSLDSQIRFLIKKTRVLLGTEPSSRGIGHASSAPLFSLDATRVVALVDRSANRKGEPLDFVTGLMNGSFSLDFGNQITDSNSDGVQTIKDFISRQCDILRGRGGLQSNASGGSVSGVGMVAAAAAAAAASAAAAKQVTAPELPSLDSWLSLSTLIIKGLLSVEHEYPDEAGTSASQIQNEKLSRARCAGEAAVSCLDNSVGLNMKFSVAWCKKSLPAAKDVYLKDLPACYPTTVHYAQLDKALLAFRSMVKGPAVQEFAKKLEDECTSIWESGRQLCDAVSLTGKPCMHQRHTVTACDSHGSANGNLNKKHSSGYFFLHACACGRSRRLQEDPFDFEFANCIASCEDDLPTLVLPEESNTSSLPPSSWRLLRLGGARYYKPSKGLLQIGFCSKENFLLKWTISLEQKKASGAVPVSATVSSSEPSSISDHKAASVMDQETKKPENRKHANDVQPGGSVSSDDTNIRFGRGLPPFTMRKPFAEVVAGTVLADSKFPVLKQSKQAKNTAARYGKRMSIVDQTDNQVSKADDGQGSQRTESIIVQESLQRPETKYQTKDNPVLQIGSNLVPVDTRENDIIKGNSPAKQIAVYIGFEHECPYGHRFLLSPEHLMELDSSYSTEVPDGKHVETGRVSYEEVLPFSVRTAAAVNNTERSSKPSKSAAYGQHLDRLTLFSRSGTSKLQSVPGLPIPSDSVEQIGDDLSHVRLDDGSCAFSLLNKNLPIYMNCPYCKISTKQNHQDIKFASTVSQLQRIFLVTPPFPTVLATCPVIQFEGSCLPQSTPIHKQQLSFTLGCQVILPPESFLTLSLPFVYGVKKDDGSLQPLRHLKHQPELSAWLVKGSALQIISMGHGIDEKLLVHRKN